MPPSPEPRTLLGHFLVQRRWTVLQFCGAYATAATTIGAATKGITERHAKRWLSGEVTKPYPAARQVLEYMFGTNAETLLAVITPQGDHSLTSNPVAFATRPGDDEHALPAVREGVGSSRRRDLLHAGMLLTAAGTVRSPAERAAQISHAIAAANPDPLTLAELQHGVHRLTTLYPITPHGALVEPVERAWDDAEALLETRVSGSSRRDLELVAGQYAYYRGQLAFDMGDDHTALTFFVLAAQHAEAATDSLLAGSVAVMRSSLAFFAGDFTRAATIAHHGQPGAHPYIAPKIAGCLARALAQSGNADGALAALHTMQDTVWDGTALPGPSKGDAGFCERFTAVTYTYLHRGEEAEPLARSALTHLDGTGHHLQIAGAHLALARALLHRQTPDPEQAATAIHAALTAADGNDHGATTNRAAGIHRRLTAHRQWAQLPAVRDLNDRLPNRRALTPSAGV